MPDITPDCCAGASITNHSINHQPLKMGCCCTSDQAYAVQSGQSFVHGELVKINPAAGGTIEKLTVAPVTDDVLGIVIYDMDNTAPAVAAGRATTRGTVYISGEFNELAVTLPGGVTFDQIRVVAQAAGFVFKRPMVV